MKKKKLSRGSKQAQQDVHSSRRVFTRRALLLIAAQTGILSLLANRLYKLQITEGDKYIKMAKNNLISKRLLSPPRGSIYDRYGDVLANNKISWRALLIPEETSNLSDVIERFSQFITLDEHDYARIQWAVDHQRRFIPIMLKDFLSWDEMAMIEVNSPTLPGVLIDTGTKRVYPTGPLLAHLVGYVAPPNEKDVAANSFLALPGIRVGRAGIENTQDDVLQGKAGEVEVEVDSVGRIITTIGRKESVQGQDIQLAVDMQLQQDVVNLIGEESASAVVLNCQNGEVMAMVSNPSFDPSLFDSGVSHAQWKAWMTDERNPLMDKAVAGLYPPGSTFKPAVGLGALEAGTINENVRINCPGYYDYGGTRFHCWNKYGHGSLNLHEALKYSCDVYFYEVARRTGMEAIHKTCQKLGLGVSLPIELTHVKAGLIPTPAWREKHGHHWNIGDTIVSGIGQGFVHVSPLQLATYTARMATGKMINPHLVRARDHNLIPEANSEFWKPIDIKPEFLKMVRSGMYAVVNEPRGSGAKAKIDYNGILLAGKTGTAQVKRVSRALRESGHFNSANLPWKYRPHALFICFAPYDNPQYAISVVVEHGNAAASVAAPLAKNIMLKTLQRDPANKATRAEQTKPEEPEEPKPSDQ
ncbi:Cell division protein FtsI [Commensalibacter communis]|uniref:penicillin-binding protein 2 n=1 Tax=Commensalibacter communis TaxID=2972786 RepID=UPI0022FFBFD4|nr:penicillin-binding protein 2 [Commensalibacter communis]CAI3927117.1 Cell division protein FtsI [Commensalibacter communis]CAI3927556.1 Cell division protein FtsI [Commensalibacter communis]CAI3927607.1 Cell division protein FtsI [Commensalibacter communis]CAI3928071.1 Cell division protein FtsI [Commensalibacter communis]CAI3931213.1 Cell division protein FtsI [Commensalibacter communis]